MSPADAAKRLDERLRGQAWYLSTGIGQTEAGTALFVYVKSDRHTELRILAQGWMGYPVMVRKVGGIRPLGAPSGRYTSSAG